MSKMELDRKLLELAAKAYGIVNFYYLDIYKDKFTYGAQWGIVCDNGFSAVWNPLVFDGDAFRLMVKLKIKLDDIEKLAGVFDVCKDNFAAIRRAIVLAAAEIGKSMP
jgi:hypothetical protein